MGKWLRFSIVGIVALIGGLAAMQPSQAYRGDYLPPGSWTQSCWDGYVDRHTLYATCQTKRGQARDSSVDMRGCNSFGNNDGYLYCEYYGSGGGGGGGGNRYMRVEDVPGNWYESCGNASIRYGTLTATCKTKNKRWRTTSLDVRQCSWVENNDGYLVCSY